MSFCTHPVELEGKCAEADHQKFEKRLPILDFHRIKFFKPSDAIQNWRERYSWRNEYICVDRVMTAAVRKRARKIIGPLVILSVLRLATSIAVTVPFSCRSMLKRIADAPVLV